MSHIEQNTTSNNTPKNTPVGRHGLVVRLWHLNISASGWGIAGLIILTLVLIFALNAGFVDLTKIQELVGQASE